MTIDELLQAAVEATEAALAVMDVNNVTECAMVAHSAATVAMAMILAQATSSGTDYNGAPMLVFRMEQLR